MKKFTILVTTMIILLSGCSNKENTNQSTNITITPTTIIQNEQVEDMEMKKMEITYETITSEQAYELMNTKNDYIILDVREQEEYDESHISNALLIPYQTINNDIFNTLTNKDQLILVYCRSGRRSAIAAQTLVDLGYTNVKDFGGIIDWPYELE
jgi:rhodanese-related sulfurtransferase